jgi:hypothetical protein
MISIFSGIESMCSTGYVSQSTLVTMFSSKRTSSNSCSAGAVYELAIDDVTKGVGVDDHADIVRTDVAQQVEPAGVTINTYLGDQRDERIEMPPERNAAADSDLAIALIIARGRTLVPAVALGRDPDRVAVTRISEIAQPS